MIDLRTSTALALILLLGHGQAFAGPEGGLVIGGSATIQQSNNTTTIQQTTQRGIINWNSFDVKQHERVNFIQPNQNSITVNRILDNKASQIHGQITANGNIMLLNKHGMLFGSQAKIDVGGLVASTSDLDNPDQFMNGAAAQLTRAGNPDAKIIQQGKITVRDAGLVGLVAPHVRNEGIIQARLGKVTLAGADITTVDFAGDGLIQIAVSDDALGYHVTNTGLLQADGGHVLLTAADARGLVDSLLSNEGEIRSNTTQNKTGRITIQGQGATVKNNGTITAKGSETENGGTINIAGDFASLGGTISADGAAGGTITIAADYTLSLSDTITARGTNNQGGTITTTSGGDTWQISSSILDAGGITHGGTIYSVTAHNLVSSAVYTSQGQTGNGGQIDITAGGVKLLSATVDASGGQRGGTIHIGGEYQGGKNLPAGQDDLPNAQIVTLDRTTLLRADGLNHNSDGGRIIVWSDEDTLALGTIYARPGLTDGAGGFVEVSSGDVLNYGATIETGRGNRAGTVLIDPKNILIADATFNPTAILLGRGYTAPNIGMDDFKSSYTMGQSVSLSGTSMAIGLHHDTGASGTIGNSGAVYLYSFTDHAFSGGKLEAILGHGYTGGNNLDLSDYLDAGDYFGSSVSLDGNRLAVGAHADGGYNNTTTASIGAAYLFTFDDDNFNGGNLAGRIGYGYGVLGGNNFSVPNLARSSEYFGGSIALDGNRLAIGAYGDDGVDNTFTNHGAVYLFTFDDSDFTNQQQAGIIGSGYSGSKDIDTQDILDQSDLFGQWIDLSGNFLIVGNHSGDGYNNTASNSGEAFLFRFDDNALNGGQLISRIGSGYTGLDDFNISLESEDRFGSGVAIDNNMLAIGAYYDNGFNNASSRSGAVYLFTFDPLSFSGLTLQGIIGNNYALSENPKSLSRPIEAANGDYFGASVALDNNRLIVGASADSGPAGLFNVSSGAYHFYTFDDAFFSNGTYHGTLGYGYTGGKNIDFPINTGTSLHNSRYAVSLSGTSLAIGASLNDGFNSSKPDSGAVYLYNFTSDSFDGITLEAILGHGYTGGNNLDLSDYLGARDWFGYDVSLDGNRLAVGATYDSGHNNATSNRGAVYLFTFDDTAFNGGHLAGRIGSNYGSQAGNNLSLPILGSSDYFGSGVSLDGNRLAVAAYGDDGAGNIRTNSGAIYLFTFDDLAFTNPVLRSTIGYGYNGTNDFNLSTLDANDYMGAYGVSITDNRLAVTAYGDDGYNNSKSNSGAAYLFSFADNIFSTPILEATIGYGYTGGKNLHLDLENTDYLSGVALEYNTLALGAPRDDGLNNVTGNSGAVYLITFDDTFFSGAKLDAIIGYGYTGGKNINTQGVFANDSDNMGYALDMDQGNLIISTSGNGFGNNFTSTGEFILYRSESFSPDTGASFANLPDRTIGMTPAAISSLLSTAQNVTLQASNDIYLYSPIFVNNPLGNGGTLTLQAGRSIFLNADIYTDNGDLNILANEKLATGIVNAQRETGAANIIMADGVTINAGTGNVYFRLDNGAGKTQRTSGNITLTDIMAGNILVETIEQTSSIILNGILSASNTDTAITLAAGKDFINNAGASALSTPNGRWLVYSDSNKLDERDGLTADFTSHYCTYQGACTIEAGNGFFHEYGSNLLIINVNTSRHYGDANPTQSYLQSLFEFSGFENGDTVDDLDLLPSVSVASTATGTAAAGTSHAILLSGGADDYYDYYFVNSGFLTITQKPVVATWITELTKEYGSANPTPATHLLFNYDTPVSLSSITSSIDWQGVNAQTGVGSYEIIPVLTASNYYFIVENGVLNITPKAITATWNGNLSKVYGDINPSVSNANFTFSGLVNGDTNTAFAVTPDFGGINTTTNAGSYVVGAGFDAANYTVTNTPTTSLIISKRDITATWNGDLSKVYGDINPSVTNGQFTFNGLINGDSNIAFTVTPDFGSTTAATGVGTYSVSAAFNATNYNVTNTPTTSLVIAKRDITATWNGDLTKVYGDINPSVTNGNFTFTGLVNGDTDSVFTTTADFGGVDATTNAGSYNVTASFNAANYNITNTPTTSLVITKRNITASWNGNLTKVYGDLNPSVTNGNFTFTGLVNGDTGSAFTTTADFGGVDTTTNAGTYTIGAGFNATNYTVTNTPTTSLVITKRNVTASWNGDLTKIYGDLNPSVTNGHFTFTGLVNGDTGSAFTTTADFGGVDATTNAGTYTIGAGFDATNYTVTNTPTTSLVITKRNVTASWNGDLTKVYGNLNPSVTNGNFTFTGLVNGDTDSVFTTTADFGGVDTTTNAGNYNVTASFDATNYNITNTPTTSLVIAKRNITAAWNGNLTKIYGDLNPSVTNGHFTFTGLVNGDTDSVFTTTADFGGVDATANVGSYNVTASFDAANYNITNTPTTSLVIAKRDITATWNGNLNKIYGDTNPEVTNAHFTFNDLVNGDTALVFSVTSNFGSINTTTDAGTYSVGATFDAINYNITNNPTTSLVIAKRNITAEIGDASAVYGSGHLLSDWKQLVTWHNLVNGDTNNVLDHVVLSSLATNTSNAGTIHTINLQSFSDNNYHLAGFTSGALTITQAPITIHANDVSRTINQSNPGLSYTVTGLKNNETADHILQDVRIWTSATAQSPAGSYTVFVADGSALNYVITHYINGTFTILLAPVSALPSTVTHPEISRPQIVPIQKSPFVTLDQSPAYITPVNFNPDQNIQTHAASPISITESLSNIFWQQSDLIAFSTRSE